MKNEETIRFEQLSKEECERLWAESKPMTIPNIKYEVECEEDMTEEEVLALHESVLRGHGYFHIIKDVTL